MLFIEGYRKQIYVDRASAASGGPPWSIRVTNARGLTAVFHARSWKLVPGSAGTLEGTGSIDAPLTPDGPALWVDTTMAIDAVVK